MDHVIYTYDDTSNNTSYAWAAYRDDRSKTYNFREHIVVALTALERVLTDSGLIKARIQDVSKVQLVTQGNDFMQDVNCSVMSKITRIDWKQFKKELWPGYVGSSVAHLKQICSHVVHSNSLFFNGSCPGP